MGKEPPIPLLNPLHSSRCAGRSLRFEYRSWAGSTPSLRICEATVSAFANTRITFPPVRPESSVRDQPRLRSSTSCACISDLNRDGTQGSAHKVRVLGHVLEPGRELVTDAVVVAPEPDAVAARDGGGMLDVVGDVPERRFAAVADKVRGEVDLHRRQSRSRTAITRGPAP
jgi:hypothetical protein